VFLGGVLRRDGDGRLWHPTVKSSGVTTDLRISDAQMKRLTYCRRRGRWLPEFGYLFFELENGEELLMAVWDGRKIEEVRNATNRC